MISDRFDHAEAEKRLYEAWEKSGAFKPSGNGEPYSIVIPPPNVTGVLHMGHALNNTLQDVLIRFHRMKGFRVLWQPGTDHAGIATQMVVERDMAKEGNVGRRELGREKFLERVWKWKEVSGGAITSQLKRLGASCDWSRERFTLDEGLNKAVNKVFVDLYREGLIYRAKRLVNWDPQFQTAISDLEVENREVKGHMWHFKYPLEAKENGERATYQYIEKDADGNVTLEETRDYIAIATTRPETMLGDGAVAVHPDDARYTSIVGKLCEIPVGPKAHRRLIPIIVDEYPDPTFGSGAVKITGAHDFNDYQVAQRNGIPLYRLMDEKAQMRADGLPYAEVAKRAGEIARGAKATAEEVDALNLVPDEYRGLDRSVARKKVVAEIEADGLLDHIEDKVIQQPFGDRSGVVIEPMLTDQWYVDAHTLAQPAIKAVETGATRFVPQTWEKTYFEWLRNIEPWCISRQLWWGHRVPAWYGADREDAEKTLAIVDGHQRGEKREQGSGTKRPMKPFKIFCAASEDEALEQAREYYAGLADVVAQERGDGRSVPVVTGDRELIIWRDEDVLDTWFSSGLWPFSTQGWPEQDPTREGFYPGSVLVTAFDIIFFWVARMMMQGIHFMGEVPFKDVYIHALVRDEKGQKMSKSKGNVMDPLDIIDGCDLETLVKKRTTGLMNPNDAGRIEKETRRDYADGIPSYGTDALRFTLALLATQGRDIKLSLKGVEGNRNFATKLWNATRFAQMNGCELVPGFDPASVKHTLNKWIVSEAARAAKAVEQGIREYKFNEASASIYRFVWDVFCDWYIELTKPLLNGEDGAVKDETRATAAWALDQIVCLLHPFMPFITEELSAAIGGGKGMLITRAWPELPETLVDAKATEEVGWVINLIQSIRSARADLRVPAGAKVPLTVVGGAKEIGARVETYRALIERLARVENTQLAAEAPKGSIRVVVGEATACLSVAELIDVAAEKARLTKEIARHEGDIAGVEKKLANAQFVAKAPPEVLEEQHERKAAALAASAKLADALKQLSES